MSNFRKSHATVSDTQVRHTEAVMTMAYSPDNKRLATGGYDRVVRIWDPTDGEEILPLTGHTGYVHDLKWSPDGTFLLSASGDHTLRIWDASTSGAAGSSLRRRIDQPVPSPGKPDDPRRRAHAPTHTSPQRPTPAGGRR
ncbi:MAG TPA: hypothetical protein P5572_11995 [Phycisphaerae bacterium]|nr:hypothetical protein [Phycisphaerae bacterium]